MNEYLNVILRNYVNFSGRARRREYWMYTLVTIIISVTLELIDFFVVNRSGSQFLLLSTIYSFATFLPGLGVSVRRLHDTGRSGIWMLIAFIPLAGAIMLLVFMATDSTPETNKWGSSPKGIGGTVKAF
ncbi:DUF805 domain-containing protein [Deinococcus ruber]|uniref:DUF805 domain-containing protein n=1 Tax=Deinococcus ruber TaxID=1848197 RepID=A0A918CNI9_9DEIO|nr:DUF805 domain-containing protein [Deinococcus ruber]GGR30752.1 DUF805 domain-containing protein [Deinococcus ruber]